MFRYLILNIIFLLIIFFLIYKLNVARKNLRLIIKTIIIMVILTAIFDPLIIKYGIVDYNRQYTIGINLFNAPIEDFFYAIAAGLLIPVLWSYYDDKEV